MSKYRVCFRAKHGVVKSEAIYTKQAAKNIAESLKPYNAGRYWIERVPSSAELACRLCLSCLCLAISITGLWFNVPALIYTSAGVAILLTIWARE